MQRTSWIGRSLALAAIIVPFTATAALAAPTSPAHGSGGSSPSATQSLMPLPSQGMDMSMPMPAAGVADGDRASNGVDPSMAGMAGMAHDGGSAATMPYIATPAAPQRHLTLAGFALLNLGVLLIAGMVRGRQPRPVAHGRFVVPASSARPARSGDVA